MGTADYCFSFFRKPIQNIEPIRAVGIVDVYRYITGHYAQPQTEALRLMATSPEAKRYKATHFDYCTFSGLFHKRNERELIMHSGLMCLDFDHVENIMELKQKILNHEYFDTELLFVSPSGNPFDENGLNFDEMCAIELMTAISQDLRIEIKDDVEFMDILLYGTIGEAADYLKEC